MKPDVTALSQCLRDMPGAAVYRVAFSGGMDSHVLLHLMVTLARQQSMSLSAVHVNHGLSEFATQWQQHCQSICDQLDVPMELIEVKVQSDAKVGLEAAARHARYEALSRSMTKDEVLLTAHHEDDQVETFLLQSLRGSGVAGLAVMPTSRQFGRGWLGRPLLSYGREQLLTYARQHQLLWVEDESNENICLDRNYLRHQVIPLLAQRWPQLGHTVGRVVKHQAEAAFLLRELAETDLGGCTADSGNTLKISSFLTLSGPRQANLLRHWIRLQGYQVPNSVRLHEFLRQLVQRQPDANPQITWQDVQLHCYRDEIHLLVQNNRPPLPEPLVWDLNQVLSIPGVGTLQARPAQALSTPLLSKHFSQLTVQFRQGGEVCQPVGRQHHHSLKKLWQERGIPSWQRSRIPLLYNDGALVAVAGHWICEGHQNSAGEPGWHIEFENGSAID